MKLLWSFPAVKYIVDALNGRQLIKPCLYIQQLVIKVLKMTQTSKV